MMGLKLTIEKAPPDEVRNPDYPSKPKVEYGLKCTIEKGGLGPFSIFLPTDATNEEIAVAFQQHSLHAAERLSRTALSPVIRDQIIGMYDEAAHKVLDRDDPGYKERE